MVVVDPNERIMQDSTWADGLRGIAAIYVAASHLVLCFGTPYLNPCCADDTTRTPWLFQRPLLRLIASGHSWVAIFFVLLGFVNALKPVRQARSGDSESALCGLSTAAFRRSFRLVLPATVAAVISWIFCQLGAYERARNSDAFWLNTNSPAPSDSWCEAIVDLFRALMATWRLAEDNVYDQPQWALVYLLQGSIMAFFVLMATVQLTSIWRSATIGACVFWSWSWSHEIRDPFVGYTVLGGILMAELSLSSLPSKLAAEPLISTILAPVVALAGLLLMSYPSSNADAMPWSAAIKTFFTNTFPESTHFSIVRLVGSTGALMLCSAIIVSPHMRRALSIKQLRWLGKISFPIYLLHATVMRTVMAWFVFAGQPLKAITLDKTKENEVAEVVYRYEVPGTGRVLIGVFLMFAVTLYASHLWTNNFEPAFGKITAWAEGKMKRPNDGPILTGPRSPRSPIEPGKQG